MYPRWAGETVVSEEIDEASSSLAKMVWTFQMILAGKLSNPDDEADFQVKIYKKISPETTKCIIASTHCLNCAIHEIGPSV